MLKVISRSAFDLRMVLDTLLQSAARLCEADQGTITQRKGDKFYRSVSYGFPAAFAEYVKDRPVEMGRDTVTGRALLERKVVHIPDVEADPDYTWKEAQRLGAFRTILGVPMLREGIPVGVLALARSEVRPFTDKQIELVATFADQAVIAIENVRLFDDVQKRTQELTEFATAADGHRRRAQGHQPLDIRSAKGAQHPAGVGSAKVAGFRTGLAVPLLRDGKTIGIFTLNRNKVNPFTEKQIELAETFADQAVIAIENARLLTELRESLEYQTAISDVLNVISRSPNALQPVLHTIVQTAARLCEAEFSAFFRFHEGKCHIAASNAEDDFIKFAREHPFIPTRASCTGRAVLERRTVHVLDASTDPEYAMPDYELVANNRTMLGVPLLREGIPLGTITLWKTRVAPFTEKQIDLITTFADQALIAIENVRLFEEVQARTRELTESLEQQTATSEVLKVISRSAFDLQAVFETVAESSARLCGADRAFIFRFDGELLRVVATFNAAPEFRKWVEQNPIRPGRHSGTARAALERRTIYIPDVLADPEYSYGAKNVEAIRTILGVPILKGDDLLGVIMIYRLEVKLFTDKQIALLETFADQAAIAIENVRLLDALRLRTDDLGRSVEELRALGEVSQAVNSTLDLATVLSTIVAKAVQLSDTEAGAIYVFDDAPREFHLRATYGMDQELIDALARQHIGFDEPNVELAFAQGEPIQVADLREDAPSAASEIVLRAGFRARLVAPLLRGEDVVGMLVVRRRAPGAFPQNTVDLMKTFAAQSVLAIQNARLFESVESRTRELAKSLEDLRTAQDRLVQTEKLASLGQLTAGIAHEIKNPLNFVNNFSAVSVELIDELREALGGAHLDSKLRAEISGDCGYAARQSRQGRAARQARGRDRQEHAAAFASGLWRAPAGRYQRSRRGEPQSRLSRGTSREAGLHYHPGEVL